MRKQRTLHLSVGGLTLTRYMCLPFEVFFFLLPLAHYHPATHHDKVICSVASHNHVVCDLSSEGQVYDDGYVLSPVILNLKNNCY